MEKSRGIRAFRLVGEVSKYAGTVGLKAHLRRVANAFEYADVAAGESCAQMIKYGEMPGNSETCSTTGRRRGASIRAIPRRPWERGVAGQRNLRADEQV